MVTAHESEASSEEDDPFLGAAGAGDKDTWMTYLQLNGKDIKMDTGAEVTVISESVYKTLTDTKLEKPSMNLYGPAHQLLPGSSFGQFTGTLTHNNTTAAVSLLFAAYTKTF